MNSRSSLILLTVLGAFCIRSTRALPIECPNSPAQWCQSKTIATRCGVTDQCASFVWKNEARVNFTIYYESLCADCRQFTIHQVWNAFQAVLEIVNLTLVPYGNAREVYRPETQLYQFYCQHGADECYGNLIHTCAIALYPDVRQHMPFVYCMDSIQGDLEMLTRQCASNASLDASQILNCTTSRTGNQLQHGYAVQTEQGKPVDAPVPWVNLNGESTEEIQEQAQTNLVRLLCQTYKGPNPPARCTTA